MRLGINLPLVDFDGLPLDAKGVRRRARMIEDADFDGIWNHDTMFPPLARPDVLMQLSIAAVATTSVELGTCIFITSVREPVETAQRVLTMQQLVGDRFTLGVGAGSTRTTHESVGVPFEDRFRLLHDHMQVIRSLSRGEVVGSADLHAPVDQIGIPRFVLGAWHSDISLDHAVREYDGWMSSAGRSNFATLAEGIAKYRSLGGTRALVATCIVDLRATTMPMGDDDPVNLRCAPDVAAERLRRLADLGFDDVLLVKADERQSPALLNADFTLEELEEIRSLVPQEP